MILGMQSEVQLLQLHPLEPEPELGLSQRRDLQVQEEMGVGVVVGVQVVAIIMRVRARRDQLLIQIHSKLQPSLKQPNYSRLQLRIEGKEERK